ncbi:hypothetical protein SLA2020_391680 [Shorea laevis]
MKKGGTLTQSFCKFKNVATSLQKYRVLDHVADWSLLCFMRKYDELIPKDVPRGHVALYVGKELKRFVIKITLLNHPLFQALLDCAEEAFEFATGPRLCIPCNETMFLTILEHVASKQDQGWSLCF